MIWTILLLIISSASVVVAVVSSVKNMKLAKKNAQLISRIDHLMEDQEEMRFAVTHDLSAPLRAIHGFCEIIKGRLKETVDVETHDFFSLIHENSTLMKSMVADVGEYYRVMNCSIKFVPVDLNILIRDCMHSLVSLQESETVQLIQKPLPVVVGDHELLQTMMTHILSNAIKFSDNHKPSVIEVFAQSGAIIIQDRGIGFDMAHRDKVFKLFQRLHLKDQFEGNGAGLAIVKRIVRRHQGSISLESEPGQGTRVIIQIPDLKKST